MYMDPNQQLENDIKKHSDPKKALLLQRYFKTGPGQFGDGDVFLGLTVPQSRTLAGKYNDISLPQAKKLLYSKFHEKRLIALLILIEKFNKGNEKTKKDIFEFYLKNSKQVNNWDLVDSSAHVVVGEYLLDKSRKILYKLARSKNLWQKRISVISTMTFIAHSDFSDALKISEILLIDPHDLIHKAVGWVLREVGKKSLKHELTFLNKYAATMPRTSLRYSIERFPEKLKIKYMTMKGKANV